MSVKTVVVRDNTKKIEKAIGQVTSNYIAIGILNPVIGEYAFYNEFGTKKIPERSFLRTTYDEKINKWENELNTGIALLLELKTDAKKVLEKTAKTAKKDIEKKLKSNIPPKNKPSTIRRKGKGKPTLYDTGALWDSVDYEVRTK